MTSELSVSLSINLSVVMMHTCCVGSVCISPANESRYLMTTYNVCRSSVYGGGSQVKKDPRPLSDKGDVQQRLKIMFTSLPKILNILHIFICIPVFVFSVIIKHLTLLLRHSKCA